MEDRIIRGLEAVEIYIRMSRSQLTQRVRTNERRASSTVEDGEQSSIQLSMHTMKRDLEIIKLRNLRDEQRIARMESQAKEFREAHCPSETLPAPKVPFPLLFYIMYRAEGTNEFRFYSDELVGTGSSSGVLQLRWAAGTMSTRRFCTGADNHAV